jgi:acetyl-CoA carboxylase carboxyl transferase subunit beta
MVVHRHDLRPTLARLCRLLTRSPALEPVSKPIQEPIAVAAEMTPSPDATPAAPQA